MTDQSGKLTELTELSAAPNPLTYRVNQERQFGQERGPRGYVPQLAQLAQLGRCG